MMRKVRQRLYILRCHNGMYACHKPYGDCHGDENPFRLEFSGALDYIARDPDALTARRWFMTTDRDQARRYRDENNALRTEDDAGYTLEIVKLEVTLLVTPGTREYDRPAKAKTRKGR